MVRYRPKRYFYLFVIATTTLSWANAPRADDLGDIKKSGEIRIGIEGTLQPFNYRDPKSGELAGFEIDLGREIAKRLGVQAKFQIAQWDALLLGLNAQSWDVVINNVYVTPARREKFAFSTPYLVSQNLLVTRKDAPTMDSLASLKGKTTAQVTGTVQAGVAEKYGASVRYVSDVGTMSMLVTRGEVDGMLLGDLEFAGLMKAHPEMPLKSNVMAELSQSSAVAMRQNSDSLRTAIDTILTDLNTEGYLSKQSVRYFGIDVSR